MQITFPTAAIEKRLDVLRLGMVQKVSASAVRAGADVIAEAMTTAAPVLDAKTAGSTALEPGALKADIRTTQGRTEEGEVAAFAGPGHETAHVARFVEYGHRMVHGGQSKVVDGEGRTRGAGVASEIDVPAHPFLRPAFEASVTEAAAARDAVLREGWGG